MTPTGRALVRAAAAANLGPIPRFGSPEFEACIHEVLRAASIAVAAEAWLEWCSPGRVEDDMAAEVRRDRQAWLADMANSYLAGQSSVKDASVHIGEVLDAVQVSAELTNAEQARKRRLTICDPTPRPGDYAGAVR